MYAAMLPMPAVAQAEDTLGQLIAALEPMNDADAASFRRAFGPRKPINRDTLTFESANVGNTRFILVADVDPNFERWQRGANERLKNEQAKNTPTLHPLAAAHPAKSVVVCEAGCGGSTTDEIVYLAPIVPAVLTASPASDADNKITPATADPAAAALADGELPCIAGCYARQANDAYHHPNQNGRVGDSSTSRGASETAIVLTSAPSRTQAGHNGGIVERRSLARKTSTASEFYDGWRTKIVFSRSERPVLPGRAWHRQGVRHDRIIISENPDEVR